MPTCTHIAYHQEAQRKARVQARRQEAILNQLRKQLKGQEKMSAYHWEARRRQIVVDRKAKALRIIKNKKEEEERARLEEEKRMHREKHDLEAARRREREDHLKQRGKGGINGLVTSQKDLRYQQKVLRDHGLVMGHVNGEFLS